MGNWGWRSTRRRMGLIVPGEAGVERNFTAVQRRSLFRMNIDDPGCAEPKLRRQRSGDEIHVVNQTSIDLLPKTGDSFRDQDVIDSELQVGMFIADMQLTERIL